MDFDAPFDSRFGDFSTRSSREPSPTNPMAQRYQEYVRQRQMTLGDVLLDNRIVFLEGVINDAAANMAVMRFLYLQFQNRTQGISFYINSPGGSVSSTLAIYDTMQFIGCPIATYCIGMAAKSTAAPEAAMPMQ